MARSGTVEVPRQPRILRLVPLAAAAAVAIALGSFLLAHQGAGRATPQEIATVRLTLEAPAALSVSVCGDWNDWNPKAQPMKRQDGKWQIDLELKRGKTYQYQFLVNGETWIPGPEKPCESGQRVRGRELAYRVVRTRIMRRII